MEGQRELELAKTLRSKLRIRIWRSGRKVVRAVVVVNRLFGMETGHGNGKGMGAVVY